MFQRGNSRDLSGGLDGFPEGSSRPLMRRRLEFPFIDISAEVHETEGAGATPESATVSFMIRSRVHVEWLGRSYALRVSQ